MFRQISVHAKTTLIGKLIIIFFNRNAVFLSLMSIDIDSSDRSWKLRYFLFRKKKDKHMYKVKGHWVGDHGTIDYAIGRLKPPLALLA